MATMQQPIDTEAEITDVVLDEATLLNESIVTGKELKDMVKEILEVVENCSIKDLKDMFQQAMAARGAVQDMSQFTPFTAAYVDLFIRQIGQTANMFTYDDLVEFHEYVLRLRKESEIRKRDAAIAANRKEYNL